MQKSTLLTATCLLMCVLLSILTAFSDASLSGTSSEAYALAHASASKNEVKIASFNIQIFGSSKMEKKNVLAVILKILSRYDLVLIQEVRDSSDTAFANLVKELSNYNKNVKYGSAISERLGRSNSKEQYGFIYNTDKVKMIKTVQFKDTKGWFERPPFAFVFELNAAKLKGQQFAILGCHIKPGDVVNELNHLVEVYDSFKSEPFYKNIILTGDFNADCSYLSDTEMKKLKLSTDARFKWLIDMDSTVADSECSYDRYIVPVELSAKKLSSGALYELGQATVYRYDKDMKITDEELVEDVSDHYPIEMTITSSQNIGLSSKTLADLVFDDLVKEEGEDDWRRINMNPY
ncbi:predicted protein [Naegleria gruberi]|uniref:Predicted protein n=1 Tax=Naegleria gruberi TaxID=5762 RepID=D2VAA7_NAEGR|nr:uncharacterized protein NAEGRDRAFT_65793 [Naegleria gruberi]EFC46274.1 predicted protein [Naegleria gruberi]|eukprot:XP_002679018.1 predicted protein [Naegleria gruberi strain NEG-M]